MRGQILNSPFWKSDHRRSFRFSFWRKKNAKNDSNRECCKPYGMCVIHDFKLKGEFSRKTQPNKIYKYKYKLSQKSLVYAKHIF